MYYFRSHKDSEWFTASDEEVDLFRDWSPQEIKQSKWEEIFTITEERASNGACGLCFLNPRNHTPHFAVFKENDSQEEREVRFRICSILWMYHELECDVSERELMDTFSFCVGGEQIKGFINIYNSANKGKNKNKTIYKG